MKVPCYKCICLDVTVTPSTVLYSVRQTVPVIGNPTAVNQNRLGSGDVANLLNDFCTSESSAAVRV